MRMTSVESGDSDIRLYRFESEEFSVVFAPDLGGRMLSLVHRDRELLWRNPRLFDERLRVLVPRASWPPLDGTLGSWPNPGGSKTWPAPQGWGGEGEWAGPPDPVLDTGEYSFSVSDETGGVMTVSMTSAADPRSGLRITRSFAVPDRGRSVRQTTTLENVSGRVIRWSPWEVAQVPTDSEVGMADRGVVVALDPPQEPVDLGTYDGELVVPAPSRELLLAVQPAVAKRGWRTASGSIGYRFAHGGTLTLRFDPVAGASYPDDGSRVEVWMQYPTGGPLAQLAGLHPSDWLVELEVLGPLSTLHPGESAGWGLLWELS